MMSQSAVASLDGLAVLWDSEEVVRRRLIHDSKLLVWLSAETVGVPTYKAASPNFEVLRAFFTLWTDTSPTPKTPSVKKITVEVGFLHVVNGPISQSAGLGFTIILKYCS